MGLNLNAHLTYKQVKCVQILMTKYGKHPLNKHNSLMSKHYALTQAFINGPAGPEVLADVGTTQHFSGHGPHVILCHAFKVFT